MIRSKGFIKSYYKILGIGLSIYITSADFSYSMVAEERDSSDELLWSGYKPKRTAWKKTHAKRSLNSEPLTSRQYITTKSGRVFFKEKGPDVPDYYFEEVDQKGDKAVLFIRKLSESKKKKRDRRKRTAEDFEEAISGAEEKAVIVSSSDLNKSSMEPSRKRSKHDTHNHRPKDCAKNKSQKKESRRLAFQEAYEKIRSTFSSSH